MRRWGLRSACCCIALLLSSACQQQETDGTGSVETIASHADNVMINMNDDTIPTGVPIPVQGRKIDPDSVAKPVTVTLPDDRKVIPAHPNVRLAGKPRVIPAAPYRTIITPGENGVPLPQKVDVPIEIVPAKQPRPVPAQPLSMKENARYDIQYLNIEHGLSSNRIKAMHKDSRGYLWLGTYDGGIIRYDGKNFIHYTTQEGISSDFVNSIIEDQQGNIWFGALNNDIVRYDGKNFSHFNIKGKPPLGRSDMGETRVLLADSKKNIWLLRGWYDVLRYDGKHFTRFSTAEGLIDGGVQAMLEDKAGNIWFATGRGLSCYDGQHFTNYSFALGENTNLITVQTMLHDSRGDIWLGMYASGVYRFDGKNFYQYSMKKNLPSNNVLALLEDSQGNIWMGSADNGAIRFDGKYFTQFSENEGLSNNQIEDMLEDSDGNIWFGTFGAGASRFDPNSFVHFSETDGLSHNHIKAIEEDNKGDIWFGTGAMQAPGRGICRYDGDNFIQYPFEPGTIPLEIRSINQDSRGYIWITSPRGIHRLDGNNWTNYTPQQGISGGFVWASVEDSKGDLWFAMGDSGLNRYTPSKDGRRGYFTQYSDQAAGLRGVSVLTINEDSQGHIWFGSWGSSLGRYDGKNITYYTTNEGLNHNRAIAPLEDGRGNYWIGTFGGGINFFRNREEELPKFIHFTEREGLVNNKITDIEKDLKQRIWVSTSKGISLFIPPKDSTNKELSPFDYRIVNFGQPDGLKSLNLSEASACLDSKNRMWWGSDKGATMLDLNKFELPTEPPRNIGLAHLEIGQQFIDYGELARNPGQQEIAFAEALRGAFDSVARFQNYPVNLTLPYNLNHLTFHFTAIDWAAPHKIQYSYLLEGYDKNWSPPQTEPVADYRRLPHGNYTLKVKAIGEAGVWSEVFAYPFTIRPPWWHTWWAYAGYALLLTSGIYYVYQFQLRKRLAEAEAERLQELDQVKNRLYTNITHEFRTPLTIMLGISDQIKNQVSEHVKANLQIINRSGRQLLKLVNQMLDLSKLEAGQLKLDYQQGDIINYLQYLLESFHSLAEAKNIRLHFISDLQAFYMDYDPIRLRHVFANLLSNAIKFTPEGGNVYVTVENPAPENAIKIKVKDTGIGIPKEKLPYIFDRFYQADDSATRRGEGTGIGLTLTRELVKLMGGEISVTSELGKGSEFTVLLPVTRSSPRTTSAKGIEAAIDQETPIPTFIARQQPKQDKPVVLIVEDNPDLVKYLMHSFNAIYNLEVAYNGQQGIDKALQLIPDIIITDVMMPEKDGFELCATLKNHELTSHIPIIMLTAKVDMDARLTGLRRGADAYLAKPFEQEELQVRVAELLKQRQRLQAYYRAQAGLADDAKEVSPAEEDATIENAFLEKVNQLLEAELSDPELSVETLSKALFVSQSSLLRKIKALTGVGPNQYIRAFRLAKAKQLLRETDQSITAIAIETGFKSSDYFSRLFKKEVGMTPTAYRNSPQK